MPTASVMTRSTGGSQPLPSLRPFDQPEHAGTRLVSQAQGLELRGVAHPIEVQMDDRTGLRLVHVHEVVRRAVDVARHAQCAQEPARQSRLARTQVAGGDEPQ